jgi:hypothetical protein
MDAAFGSMLDPTHIAKFRAVGLDHREIELIV